MRIHPIALFLGLGVAAAPSARAQTALRAAPSTRATSEVSLTPAEPQAGAAAKPLLIRLDYGQPHLRGRTLHTDSLVPYDKPWRAGANAATRLTTDVDLVIGGSALVKGTYVLFLLPSSAGWKLLVLKNGPEAEVTYDAANEIARIDMRRRTLTEPVESLTMALIPVTGAVPARGELRVSWGTFAVSVDWSVK
jgi:hypothetical protein